MTLEGYEAFDKRVVPSTSEPFVTLQKGGLLSINGPAYEKFESPEAVELFYNRKERKIALRPATADSPRAFPVRKQGARGKVNPTNLVSLTAFCSYYGIDHERARRYKPEFEEGGVMTVDLTQKAADATGGRVPQRAGRASE